MIYHDSPIQKQADSSLPARTSFANYLGELISSYSDKQNLTIGLIGSWGTGKTSIINMVLEQIDPDWEHEKRRSGKNNNLNSPVIIKFNPWNYSDQNQLIQQFFYRISNILGRVDKGKTAQKISTQLDSYGKAFKLASMIPVPGLKELSDVVSEAFSKVGENTTKYAELANQDLHAIKTELSKLLEAYPRKLLVVIDDIDRLNKNEIRMVFQLIKSLADFPNTVYLLSFDRHVVYDALSDSHSYFGKDYLDKIIQIPIEVPKLTGEEINDVLVSGINELLTKTGISTEDWKLKHENYFLLFFQKEYFQLLENIRDIKRFLNLCNFTLDFASKELNIIDYLAVSILQVKAPSFYQTLQEHKGLFLGVDNVGFQDKQEIKKHNKEKVEKLLESIKDTIQRDRIKEGLCCLFPYISYLFSSFDNERSFLSNTSKHRIESRICCVDLYDRYFRLSLKSSEISQAELNHLFLTNSPANFNDAFASYLENNKGRAFIEALDDFLAANNNISEDRKAKLLSAWLNYGDKFIELESDGFWADLFINEPRVSRVTYNLMASLQKDPFSVLRSAFQNTNESIEILFKAYFHLHQGIQGKKSEIITLEQLDDLKSIVLEKVQYLIDNEHFFDSLNPVRSLLNLQHLYPEKVQSYLNDFISNTESLVKLLQILTEKGYRYTAHTPKEDFETLNSRIINSLFIDIRAFNDKLNDFLNQEISSENRHIITAFLGLLNQEFSLSDNDHQNTRAEQAGLSE